jgi:plasmid rolling circle replication initiator protein Rep
MNKYNKNKYKSQGFSVLINTKASDSMMARIKTCGDFLAFIADYELQNKKLTKGNFCNHRFCPLCAWRLTKKNALKLDSLMKYINIEHQKEFIFMTLTTPNVPAEKLKDEIDKYNKDFTRLLKRKEFLNIKGYVRKLEVTYNAERNDFHPHFHCIFAVNKRYFTTKEYIKHQQLLDLWRDVTGQPEITQVSISKIEPKIDYKHSAYEVATYSAKPDDYLTHGQDIFNTFYSALSGRQLLVYSGLFAKANSKFKKKELDKYKIFDENTYHWFLKYFWAGGEYLENEKRELREDEKEKYNGKFLDQFDRADDEE